jgi:hypothetical protein
MSPGKYEANVGNLWTLDHRGKRCKVENGLESCPFSGLGVSGVENSQFVLFMKNCRADKIK